MTDWYRFTETYSKSWEFKEDERKDEEIETKRSSLWRGTYLDTQKLIYNRRKRRKNWNKRYFSSVEGSFRELRIENKWQKRRRNSDGGYFLSWRRLISTGNSLNKMINKHWSGIILRNVNWNRMKKKMKFSIKAVLYWLGSILTMENNKEYNEKSR